MAEGKTPSSLSNSSTDLMTSMTPGRGDRRISLDELRLAMAQITGNMRSFVESLDGQAGEKHLPNLACAVDSMVAAFPSPPPYNACYRLEWIAFASGTRKHLDLSAVRYLCWEPNIASSHPFLAYLWRRGLKLKSRPLAGLVRSCHAMWKAGPGTYPAAGVIKDLVKQYEGSSQVILKWKSNLNAVFGANGPEELGRSLIFEKKKLSGFLEEWYLDPQSPFAGQVVERATALCRDQFDNSPAIARMLFGELLPWAGWDMSALRQEIGELILRAEDGQTRNTLQKFVMTHRSLGDPRLPKNRANWAEMNEEAKSRFEGWLVGKPSAPVERVNWQPAEKPSAAVKPSAAEKPSAVEKPSAAEKPSAVEKPSSPSMRPSPAEKHSAPMERVYRQGKGWTLQPVGETHYEAARFGSSGT